LDPKLPSTEHFISGAPLALKGNLFAALSQTGHIYLIAMNTGKLIFSKLLPQKDLIGMSSTDSLLCVYDAHGHVEIFSI